VAQQFWEARLDPSQPLVYLILIAELAWLHSDDPPFLLDVREPNEWEIGHLPDAQRISINELQGRLNELDTAREMVVYCRSGARSGRAVDMLRAAGFRKVKNMTGGILRWSDDVDASIPKY